MKRIFLFLAAIASTVGCTTDEQVLEPTPDVETMQEITLTVSTADKMQSRVAVSDDNNADATNQTGTYSVTWAEGDQLAVLDDQNINTKFNISNAEEGTFTGEISAKAKTLYLVHPYVEIASRSFNIDLTKQTAKADLSHLSAQTYMRSGVVKVTNSEIGSSVAMSHIGAIADVKIICPEAASYTLNKVILSSLGSKATIAIKDVDYTATTEDITVTVEGITADSEGCFTVPVNILETELAANSTVTIKAVFTDAKGAEHTGEKVINITNAATIARGSRNIFKATMELNKETTDPGITDPGTSGETTVWTLPYTNIKLTGSKTVETAETCDNIGYNYKFAFREAKNAPYCLKLTGQNATNRGYIYNTTGLKNISKIELDIIWPKGIGKNANLEIWVGTESGAMTKNVFGPAPAEKDQTLTIDNIESGFDYFYIKNGGTLTTPAGITEIRVTSESDLVGGGDQGGDQGGDTTTPTPTGENILNLNHYGFENNMIGTWWNNGANTWSIIDENPASGAHALKVVFLASSTKAGDGQIASQPNITDAQFSLTAGKYEISFMLRVDVKSTASAARAVKWTIANNNASGGDVWLLEQYFPILTAENALGEWTKITKTVTIGQDLTDARLRIDFVKNNCTAGTTYCIDDLSIVAL